MIVLAYLFALLDLYALTIIVRALISWFEPSPSNIFYQFLVRATEPVLRPIRRRVPPWRTFGLDLSPVFAVLLIVLIKRVIAGLVL